MDLRLMVRDVATIIWSRRVRAVRTGQLLVNLAQPFHLCMRAPRSLTNPSKRLHSNFVDHAMRQASQWTGLILGSLTKSREMAAYHAKVAT
jgi:hypothetical protein